jgi:thiol-disulfide isomerase/thioredoxin
MLKKLFLFVSILVAVPTIALARPAPDFTLPDQHGNPVSLSDFKGKPVVIHFWATWCPYCKKLQPGLVVLQSFYQDQDLTVIGINIREDDGSQPQTVLSRRGHNFKTLLNGDAVAEKYGVVGTPTTVFIDTQGNIVGTTNTATPNDPELRTLARKAVR